MIAALGTLAFLTTLWLLVVVGAAVLEESGGKIAAALRGDIARRPTISRSELRIRVRSQVRPARRARAPLRAAA